MENKRKNFLIFTGVLVVIILFAVFYYFLLLNKFEKNKIIQNQSLNEINNNNIEIKDYKSRQELKVKIKTPELTDKDIPTDIAKPTDVIVLSGPANNVAIRFFEIKGEGGQYIPNKIVVNDNDIVTIKFYAVDADYDLLFPDFGSYLEAKKGEKKQVQFQVAGVGEYIFMCKNCKDENMKGLFIVNQK